MQERIINGNNLYQRVERLWRRPAPELPKPNRDLPIYDAEGNIVTTSAVYTVTVPKDEVGVKVEGLTVYYRDKENPLIGWTLGANNVSIDIPKGKITAFIGPSGCGKSTVLRSINRMNDSDMIPGSVINGAIFVDGDNIYREEEDPYQLRTVVGMVIQEPEPFEMSIFDNVAFGPKMHGITDKATLQKIVEDSLKKAALWDQVKGNLKKSGTRLSGGQKQRLGIARTLALEPEILLLDEPCSALDPQKRKEIENLMRRLADEFGYTIIVVTHDMHEAERVADITAYFGQRQQLHPSGEDFFWGELVEVGRTKDLFKDPQHKETKRFIAGKI